MEKVAINMGGQKYKLPSELLLSKHQFSFVQSALAEIKCYSVQNS